GPAHNALLNSNALLRQLHRDGVIQPDALSLGISVNALSQTLNARGEPNPHLSVAGPAARGRFGELMGLPQVAEHAESVAHRLLSITPSSLSERCPGSLTH
ncbi:FAD-dependent oxidoreductase, partial [Pantoea anthophila]